MMLARYAHNLGDLTNPAQIGVTVCDPTTDNACLLQQDYTQEQAAAAAAAIAAATPKPSFTFTEFLGLAAVAAAGWYAWKSGMLRGMSGAIRQGSEAL